MLAAIALCLIGLAVLIFGAELIIRGGGTLARQLGIPPIVIGLTIVAIGTSAPELAVGIDAALLGNGALAVGNIAGTNTVNILLILGLSALIRPLALRAQTIRMDLPAMILAALLMLAMAHDGRLSRLDGLLLVLCGVGYTALVVRSAQRESRAVKVEFAREYRIPKGSGRTRREMALSTMHLLLGIAVVVAAAGWFVQGAVALARLWEVSDAFIGLTIVAIGTSAPELVTTIVSTLKDERDIAIGNLLGSSVYNILVILGLTCVVPASGITVTAGLIAVDIPVMVLAVAICAPVFLSGRQVTRIEGGGFVAAYGLYLGYLIVTQG